MLIHGSLMCRYLHIGMVFMTVNDVFKLNRLEIGCVLTDILV